MKIIKFLFNPRIRFGYLSKLGLLNWMDDKKYLEKEYKLNLGEKLDLENPKTFNEKIQWLKLNDRKDIYTTMVDKYEVKKYISDLIGSEYIIPTLGVYDKFDEIDFDKLPNQFVIKCTHDSGGIIICKDKNKFDKKAARKKINKFLKRKYYYVHREWPYKNVKPRIIVEKYMTDSTESSLKDYKLFVFSGKVKIIQVDYDRFVNHKRNMYDTNWKYIPFSLQYPNDDKYIIPEPKSLSKMINIAEKIALDLRNLPFVRIDFYEVDGKPLLGEVTFYHGAGYENFTPEKWDKKLGDLIDLSGVL